MTTNNNNYTVIAVYNCGLYGIEILNIELDNNTFSLNDRIAYKYPDSDKIHKSKIHYGANKTTFRTKLGSIDLNECLRV